ncbi:hypothetical protein JK151_08965 [Ralstonia syzygii subsp. celebesensis]|uniref:Uncharacterized protein n=2 Tax=Ralstonia syzygii subsp. celebesensis TaxID=1310168 RepID=A0A1U9VEK5_9RALS|nr:hypothetical protein [Ralstonia syzygii]AQW29108.1 hypothetical protein B0B51_03160 [blood disease bacterium A2-HR MARDI]QQV54349.1 hypothetical protein JK151_08965 [Ralstonia syzygii subsp. celebesensis]CCA79397.1 putative phage protein p34 [blood disease bacterium R229]
MYLPALDDETLLRHAQADLDPLTSTPLEIELLKRFDALLNAQDETNPLLVVLEEHGIDQAEQLEKEIGLVDEYEGLDIRQLLEAIVAAGIDDAESLKERLARADEFDAIAKDAGDLFARLNTLATKE